MDETVDSIINNAVDTRLPVDTHLENILTCLSLVIQRLEFVIDMNIEIQPYRLMRDSFQAILDDMPLVRPDDPLVVQIISSLKDQV